MKAEESLALIAYRLERSRESIRAAEIMFENNMLTFSMNRVYYAMFYAVQALLVSREVSFSKHGQVKAYFNREMVSEYLEKAKGFISNIQEYLRREDGRNLGT
jgi:uncharacterized protein (UPF0332 family)